MKEFVSLRELIKRIEHGDNVGAIELAITFGEDLAKYEEAVSLTLQRQAKAAEDLIATTKQTTDMLSKVTPLIVGKKDDANQLWLIRFHEMCALLGTLRFPEVEQGRVYLDQKAVMFKGSTLINYMQKFYGELPKRHHFDVAKHLVRAESSSVARQNFRARVWVVRTTDTADCPSNF